MRTMPTTAGQKLLALMVLIPLLAGALILGIFFFAMTLAVLIVLATAIFLRAWWLGKKRGRASKSAVLEGEYRVVTTAERRQERDRHHHHP